MACGLVMADGCRFLGSYEMRKIKGKVIRESLGVENERAEMCREEEIEYEVHEMNVCKRGPAGVTWVRERLLQGCCILSFYPALFLQF